MKQTITAALIIALLAVLGAVAQAPQTSTVYQAPDGGLIFVTAVNGAVVVNLYRSGAQAQIAIQGDQASVSVQQGAHLSQLTPTALIVDGIRRF